MQVLCAEDNRIADSLMAVIKRTVKSYFEINLDDVAGILQSIRYMRMLDGRKLSDSLDVPDYDKVKVFWATGQHLAF